MFSGRVLKSLGQLPAHWGAAGGGAGLSNYRNISQLTSGARSDTECNHRKHQSVTRPVTLCGADIWAFVVN